MNIRKKWILLIVIYISFISLGLPDTILGAAWPDMRGSFGLQLQAAGIITVITTIGTAISSFVSGVFLRKLGTGKVVFFSTVLTGIALLGYAFTNSFFILLLFTIPLGIGAGAVDTGINNYVAINYTQRDMNWLHCFWGIGAFIGPNVVSLSLMYLNGWRSAYKIIGTVQLSIALVLLLSLSLWKPEHVEKVEDEHKNNEEAAKPVELLKRKDVLLSVVAFPMYIAVEMTVGVWFASYLVEARGFTEVSAGVIVSLFYISITAGRFLSGVLSGKLSSRTLIRYGLIGMAIGGLITLVPVNACVVIGIIILGVGCAPVFPGMLHNTPAMFGEANSQQITGYQIGCSYLSGVIIVPAIGLIASKMFIQVVPVSLLVFTFLVILTLRKLERMGKNQGVS